MSYADQALPKVTQAVSLFCDISPGSSFNPFPQHGLKHGLKGFDIAAVLTKC